MPCDADHPDLFEPDNAKTCEDQNQRLSNLLRVAWRRECLVTIWRTGVDPENPAQAAGWAACRQPK